MTPLTTEPDHLRVVLKLARRKAFYNLVLDITEYMRSQLELRQEATEESDRGSATGSPAPPPYSPDGAPLFALPANDRSNSEESLQRHGSPRNQPKGARPPPPSPTLIRLRKAALLHFGSWRIQTLGKLKEVVSKADGQAIADARRKRAEALAARSREVPAEGEDLLDFGEGNSSAATAAPGREDARGEGKNVQTAQGRHSGSPESFQNLYHPLPTMLVAIPVEDRKEVLSATLLILLSTGSYSAYLRTLMCYLASALQIPPQFLDGEETQIATTMVESAQKADEKKKKGSGGGMSADAVAEKRRQQGQASRFWKVGLASVAGAAIIGVTGGLAAPVVAGAIGGLMGSVGLGGLASFLGIFWMNGALVGTLFGAFGAKMTGEMIDNYAKEVEDFKFLPLRDEWGEGCKKSEAAEARRLRVTIGINGWLTSEGDVTKPWRCLGDESEVFALRYEMKSLLALGAGLESLVTSYAWSAIRTEVLRRTVLATVWAALWPVHLVSMASNLDNPFSLARNRSEKAGRVLADALINKVQGERPVTLIGYSLGARVIYACLRALAEKRAFGLVDTVVLVGAPVPSNPAHWQLMRTVVTGKMFNVYSANDLILAFLYRATSAQLGIAGLSAISSNGDGIEGVENLDLSEEVQGHLRYPGLIAKILTRCGFPDVRGGEGSIEKEGDDAEIRLHDRDLAPSGSLIDYEGTPPNEGKPQQRPSHMLHNLGSEKFDPSAKNVQEQKSDASVRQARITGSANTAKQGKGGPVATSSMPALSESPTRDQVNSSEPLARSVSAGPTHRTIPGTLEASRSLDENVDDNNDNDYRGGIRMMDYDDDGDMEILEPLAIED
ncbi:hypothetical protein DL766_009486 [Monosporascus sp. MC13-8B]|nr:hypothetical protein DL763_008758 [Monosporascus cannonballus]RYP15134.1 hypothetical protein DL766_009486 [Monosporascus sp. MC13-8B]